MDYIKANVSDLVIGDDILWRGKPCKVTEILGPNTVKIQEYKNRKVGDRELKDRKIAIGDLGMPIDKIITRDSSPLFAELSSYLVTQYKMNDKSASTTVTDTKGVNNATITQNTNLLTTTGKVGSAFKLNGVSDYINCNKGFESTFQDSFSIVVGAKINDFSVKTDQSLCGFYEYNDSYTPKNLIHIQLDSNWILQGYYYSNEEGVPNFKNAQAETSSACISSGYQDWHLFVMVVDNSSRQIYLYVDGILQTLGTGSSKDGSFSAALDMTEFALNYDFYVGARNAEDVLSNNVYGILDNFMLFSKALTQAEITALYNNGSWAEDITYN